MPDILNDTGALMRSGVVDRVLQRTGAVLFSALFGLNGGDALAQTPAPLSYETAFSRSFANPGDLDAAFRFAEAATGNRQYEAAIGALERMLFFNPDLPRVRLELGVLYLRLGAYAQARSYFQSAIEGASVPEDIRSRVAAFLKEIERREDPSQFSGFLQAGTRYQTNANFGPSDPTVRAFGFDAALTPRYRKRGDWNVFTLGSFRHAWDLGNQRGDTWETSAQFYVSRQFRATDYDTAVAEIATGPRFSLGLDSLPRASIRPYALIGALGLGDRYYATTPGGGVTVSLPFDSVAVEFGSESRYREFNNTRKYPRAGEQTGVFTTGFAGVIVPLAERIRLLARGSLGGNEARFAYNSFFQRSFDVSVSFEIAPLFLDSGRAWSITPTVGGIWYDYEKPNPIVDPGIRRRDDEQHVGVVFDMPFHESASLSAQVQYARNGSSLPNYRYRDLSVMFGPSVRF